MAPPSQLAIATSALSRLVKEERSYHRELEQQQASIANLEQGGSGDENADFQLRQEVSFLISSVPFVTTCYQSYLLTAYQRKALEETRAIFPQLRTKIQDQLSKLESQLVRCAHPLMRPAFFH